MDWDDYPSHPNILNGGGEMNDKNVVYVYMEREDWILEETQNAKQD